MTTQRRDLFALADGITNRRAIGYARYSSLMQKDGWTIQAQSATLTDHFEAKDIPLITITKDEAKSGKNLVRDGLDEALGYIRRGEANILAVAKLDRATRDAFDAFGLERELRQRGAALYCIEENIDTSDPQAFLQFGVHALMAQHFRRNLAGETAKGKRARVAAGLPNGDPPYGYRRATAADLPDAVVLGDAEALARALRRHPYSVVPGQAEAIRFAFTLYAGGAYSDATIAAELNRRGYVMVSKKQPVGGPFKKDTVTAMLADPFYCGRVSYAGLKTHGKLDLKLQRRHGRAEINDNGKHEAIITPKLYDDVQALRASRRRVGPARQPNMTTGRIFIASRLARCSVCGERLRGNAGRAKAIYRDCSPERGIACTAHRRRIDAVTVHNCIAAFVSAIRLPADWRDHALAAATRDETATHRQDRRGVLERKRARLKDLVKEGILTAEEYRADVAAIDAELTALGHDSEVADVEVIASTLANLGKLWTEATDEERLEIAAGLIDAVWIDLDGKKVLGIEPAGDYHPLQVAFPAVWSFSGTDEIRTRDLLRDRQAC